MSRPPTRTVRTGLDALVASQFRALRGRTLGLVANPTAVDRRLRHAADLLQAARGLRLQSLFGPEHGVRGDAPYMAAVGEERDRLWAIWPAYDDDVDSYAARRPTETAVVVLEPRAG